eukprot:scaffold175_cov150-Isochrysis_galbana.AAC.12
MPRAACSQSRASRYATMSSGCAGLPAPGAPSSARRRQSSLPWYTATPNTRAHWNMVYGRALKAGGSGKKRTSVVARASVAAPCSPEERADQ